MTNAAGRRRLVELVFLHRGPLVVRGLVVVLAAAGCGVAGVVLFRLHEELALRLASGASLDPLQAFVAAGSSLATLWPGWFAAACFALAIIRLRAGPLEPAPGVRDPNRRSIATLRHGLRGEYTVVRIILVVVSLVAAVDSARALAFFAGTQRAGVSAAGPWPVYAEAGGLVIAAVVLAVYAWAFGTDIGRIGAI